MKNFTFGFLQVFLVSIQTWFIASLYFPGIAVGGYLISFVWTLNVRAMSIGGWRDRIVYSTGAMCGAVCGVAAGVRLI